MQTLFIISVLCFLGILWAALALARHIKAGQLHSISITPAHSEFKQHLFSAISITPETAKSEPLRITPLPVEPLPIAPPPSQSALTSPDTPIVPPPVPEPAPAAQRSRINELNQSVHDIAANKQWILPPHPVRAMRLPLQRIGRTRTSPEISLTHLASRKPPQSASRSGVVHRLDPAYFNKDLGDLSDPYQPQPGLRVNEQSRRN